MSRLRPSGTEYEKTRDAVVRWALFRVERLDLPLDDPAQDVDWDHELLEAAETLYAIEQKRKQYPALVEECDRAYGWDVSAAYNALEGLGFQRITTVTTNDPERDPCEHCGSEGGWRYEGWRTSGDADEGIVPDVTNIVECLGCGHWQVPA